MPISCAWLVSMRQDNDAFLVSLRADVGDGGLRPECDFWPRRLVCLGKGRLDIRAEENVGLAWTACEGLKAGGGDGDCRCFCSCRAEKAGKFMADLGYSARI